MKKENKGNRNEERERPDFEKRYNLIIDMVEAEIEKTVPDQNGEIIEEISKELGIGCRTLNSIFLFITGESLGGYITGRRVISTAMFLIENPSYTLEQAAEQKSFADAPQLCKMLKKEFGKTSSELRKDGYVHVEPLWLDELLKGSTEKMSIEEITRLFTISSWRLGYVRSGEEITVKSDLSLSELINQEEGPCKTVINVTNHVVDVLDEDDDTIREVDEILEIPDMEFLAPYGKAMADFLQSHDIELAPEGPSATTQLRNRNMLYDFYAFREEKAVENLRSWLSQNKIKIVER